MTPSLPDSHAPAASRIERLEALFWAAVDMPRDQVEAFLSAQCADDPDLRRELQRMLAAEERAGAFLEIPLPEILAADLPHASVARWKLLERVGEGGLGVVYRAECIEDGVRLEAAVKILRPGFDTGRFREKFVKERQILAGLDHPGIVRLMDCGADSCGRSFLVMEFIQGEPLNTYLERAGAAVQQRLQLFESICVAVSYLHSRLIIHGDIKPANVLVTAAGLPKLLDFGASSLLAARHRRARRTDAGDADAAIRQSGAEARRGAIGCRRHLFARAAVGRDSAWRRPNTRMYVTFSRGPWPSTPRDRYLSVPDLLEDLRRLREGLPLRARPATAAYVARRFLRRNWAVSRCSPRCS